MIFANEGADVIMPVAGPVGLGAMDAVKELNAAARTSSVIWVDTDGFESLALGQRRSS